MRPVPTALVTHGHSDHARGGHGTTIATAETLAIMAVRYETQAGASPVAYGETRRLPGGVDATFLPAGHVLGSAQILLEHAGERVIVTGDYKRRPDPTCPPFVVTPCDIFVTEATFALPVFRHPPVEREIAKLLAAREANPERCVLVGAYALGKAQRVIAELRRAGYAEPIWLHGALERMCRLYEEYGVDLGDLRLVADAAKADLAGQIVLCPPRRTQRPLEPAPARSDHGDGERLDAGAPARRAAQCRAALGHFRPCRLGRTHRDDHASEPERDLDHPWPRRCSAALVRTASAPRAGAGAGGV